MTRESAAEGVCAEILLAALETRRPVRSEIHACLPSTNDRARTLALSGEEEGLLVLAEKQTAGRGRQDRRFFSPEKTGVYMSLLLRPETLSAPEKITAAAAVATARAVEEISGQPAGIKWVNDVYMRGRKVAGILTEGGVDPDGRTWVVLGIGVNLLPPEEGFPAELEAVAGAVFTQGEAVQREKLIAKIVDTFFRLYDEPDEAVCRKAYRERSVVLGKKVYIIYNSQETEVEVLGIGEDFSLLVRTAAGETLALRSGEVRIRPVL